MTKYVCKRNEVCGGLLLYNGEDCTNLEYNNGQVYRGILFNKDELGYANDLIYDVGVKYPIKNLCYDSINSFYYVNYYIELEELLKYLGYNKELTQNDLNKIYKKFILHNRWLNNNKELFGLLKMYGGSYGEGGTEFISLDIYRALESISYFLKNARNNIKVQGKLVKKKKLVI